MSDVGMSVCLHLVCVHPSICEYLFSVVVFQRSMVNWRRRVSLPLVYMLNLFGVVVLHRSMVN